MKKLVKAIYDFIPFKKQIFTALKFFWKPKQSVFKHLHFKDVITVPVTDSKNFKVNHFGLCIENEIFWQGLTNGWEKESLKLWIKLCETSETIIDIGANTGIYSLVAKAVNPSSKVYSFEPHPYFFSLFKKNILLNNYDIHAYRKAISNSNGVVEIDDYSTNNEIIKAEAMTLDVFIKQSNIKAIDLIKIDTELHEPKVLEGFSTYLKEFRPTLLIEIIREDIAQKVNEYIKGLGYLNYNIDEKGSIRQTDRIEVSDHFNYLLCNAEIAAKIGLPVKKI
ncbi:MAG: FkbM family methyltransferase [Bacteroidia bacterium]|nr:FkbM family methyltransferase [Bacteroidia bacterium]